MQCRTVYVRLAHACGTARRSTTVTFRIIESVEYSISRDGPDTPIYVMHYKMAKTQKLLHKINANKTKNISKQGSSRFSFLRLYRVNLRKFVWVDKSNGDQTT